MQPLINQIQVVLPVSDLVKLHSELQRNTLGPISEQGKLHEEIMELNIAIAAARQKVTLTEQLNAIEINNLKKLLAQKYAKERMVLSV